MRSTGTCILCGDPRVEIVSHGRCAKCLGRVRREAERRGEPVHNPAEYSYLRELNKYHSRFLKAVTALEDGAIPETFISAIDHQTIRRILRESIDRVQVEKKASEHRSSVRVDDAPANDSLLEPDLEEESVDEEAREPTRLTIVAPESRLAVNKEPVGGKDEES